jgi:hypothetical protein
MVQQSRHVSVWIDVSPPVAYGFAGNPRNLPRWAGGLAQTEVRQEGDHWAMTSPMGDVLVEFAPSNDFGVLDHDVSLPDGETFYNPMRVLPAGGLPGSCEVVFTVRRRSGMSDTEFEADVAAVAADLEKLKNLLETDPAG